jgi:hypothetical protein
LRNICVTDDYGYGSFVVVKTLSLFPLPWLNAAFLTSKIRWVSLVEQQLLAQQGNIAHLIVNGIRVVPFVKLHVFTFLFPLTAISTYKRDSIRLGSHLFCRGFTFYLLYLYLLTYNVVQTDFHIRWCSCRLIVTWRVSCVEQPLLPSRSTRFLLGSCCYFFIFCVVVCGPLCIFLLFSLGHCIVCPSIYGF